MVNLHSTTNSGLILGGQKSSRDRQTVFFTAVNPMNKEHKDPFEIDLTAPRLAWYKQKNMEKTPRHAVGPPTGGRCSGLWRAIASLMKPWCAEGDVPTAANLNLYRGRTSRVGWHSDDEPVFGECGEAKLIVSVSFGTRALFKWKGKSCSDSDASSCWLEHGDLLVLDGQCQDEYLHCTGPGLADKRVNITCCLPTCAQASSVFVTELVGQGAFGGLWVLFGFCVWDGVC